MQIVQPESVGFSAQRLERINRVMQGYVDRHEFAGIITLVARRGQVAHLEKFGWQEIETSRPMAFDTLFRIYSMTKPITSAAVMMLVEEGKVRLIDPLTRYVPAFKDVKVMVARGGADYDLVEPEREIRIHDLFTHTAGLSYGFDDQSALDALYRKNLWEKVTPKPQSSLEEVVQTLAKLPLAYHPGKAFRYSLAIDVLGYVVQVASGMPFGDFLRQRIFEPLGMVDTSFYIPPEKESRFAKVYEPGENGLESSKSPEVNHFTNPNHWQSGGGGLVSTVSDYFRFGQMLLNHGALDGVRLLGRKTVEWMLQNHLPEGLIANNNPANGFGLGGAVMLRPGLSHIPGSIGKFGWGGAANTEWWIDPVEQMQGLIMTQYMPAFTLPLVEDFEMAAYQALE